LVFLVRVEVAGAFVGGLERELYWVREGLWRGVAMGWGSGMGWDGMGDGWMDGGDCAIVGVGSGLRVVVCGLKVVGCGVGGGVYFGGSRHVE
jgi:hypothetical protein